MLLFTASEIETATSSVVGSSAAGLLGGMCGGIAQAYATMGENLLGSPSSSFSTHIKHIRVHDMHENG